MQRVYADLWFVNCDTFCSHYCWFNILGKRLLWWSRRGMLLAFSNVWKSEIVHFEMFCANIDSATQALDCCLWGSLWLW
jgi:hypothetical protein